MSNRLFKRRVQFVDGTQWNTLNMITDTDFCWVPPSRPNNVQEENMVKDWCINDMMQVIENGYWEEVSF